MLQPGKASSITEDIGAEQETVVARSLVWDLTTVSTVVQELDVPEMLAAIVTLAIPVQKELVLVGGAAPGELDGECKDRAIDWGSHRLLSEFGSMEKLVEWSSPD